MLKMYNPPITSPTSITKKVYRCHRPNNVNIIKILYSNSKHLHSLPQPQIQCLSVISPTQTHCPRGAAGLLRFRSCQASQVVISDCLHFHKILLHVSALRPYPHFSTETNKSGKSPISVSNARQRLLSALPETGTEDNSLPFSGSHDTAFYLHSYHRTPLSMHCLGFL